MPETTCNACGKRYEFTSHKDRCPICVPRDVPMQDDYDYDQSAGDSVFAPGEPDQSEESRTEQAIHADAVVNHLVSLCNKPGFDKDVNTAIRNMRHIADMELAKGKEHARVEKEVEQYRIRTEKLSPEAKAHVSNILGDLGTTYRDFVNSLVYFPLCPPDRRKSPVRRHLCMEVHILTEKYDLPVQICEGCLLTKITQYIIDGAGLDYDAHRVTRDTVKRFHSKTPV